MENTGSNFDALRREIPGNVKIVAVSKTKTVEEIMRLYNAGHRMFGENRVQEILEKKPLLPQDIQWHMVGHLQTNKVKYIAPFISMIQSVDSFKLLRIIDREGAKNARVIPCLLQVYIAREETKYGFSREEIEDMLASGEFSALGNIEIRGLMGMATFTEDPEKVRQEFRYLKELFDLLRERFFTGSFSEVSMGMSGDYKVAVEEGATMVRIGSLIFGSRCSV